MFSFGLNAEPWRNCPITDRGQTKWNHRFMMNWHSLMIQMFSFGLNAELWRNCRTIVIGQTKLNFRCTLLKTKKKNPKSSVLKMKIKTENSKIMFYDF